MSLIGPQFQCAACLYDGRDQQAPCAMPHYCEAACQRVRVSVPGKQSAYEDVSALGTQVKPHFHYTCVICGYEWAVWPDATVYEEER